MRNESVNVRRLAFRSLLREKGIFIIFFLLILVLHIQFRTDTGDDSIHRTYLESQSIFQRIYELYFQVNGKVLPDLCAAIFSYASPIFWKMLDSLMYVISGYCIYRIFLDNKKNRIDSIVLSLVVILFLSLNLISSAGYVAGSTNYIWTSAMMLLAFMPLYKNVKRLNIRKLEYPIYIFAAFYAGNQEQTLAILVVMYLIVIIGYLRKRTYIFTWLQMCVLFLSTALLMLSPGHRQRSMVYSRFAVPYFPMLSFWDKLHLGITTTFSHFLSYYQHVFGVLCLLLAVSIFLKYKNFIARIYATVPLAWMLVIISKDRIVQVWSEADKFLSIFCFTPDWGYGLPDYNYIDALTYTDWKYYIPIIVTFFVCGCIMIDIILAVEGFYEKIVAILILCAGICSRVIMAFSPTLYGSSFRTYSFMYLSLLIIVAIVAKQLMDQYNDKKTLVLSIIAVSVGMGF